ncbi:SAM-dependent methyltransferase [Pseudonocardia sp. TMWB2A]|uniref:class I SAM-dependent methyltransferase n=1 Tax=Pseudonocardia sp. TMWB2A TaxID=687430 RepID=UPI00307EF2E9
MSPAGRGTASDGSPVAPDGSPVGLYRLYPPGREPALIHDSVAACCTVLELGCGAGRITHALLALGHAVVAVDESAEMLSCISGAQTVMSDIETLDLPDKFRAVVLGSYLINTTVPGQRDSFFAACVRHVHPEGAVLIQRTSPEFARSITSGSVRRSQGFVSEIRSVSFDSGVIRVEEEWRRGEVSWTHNWADLVLSDERFVRMARSHGLTHQEWLDPHHEWSLSTPSTAPD